VLDHISLPAADLRRAAAFYDAVLATVGLRRTKESARAIGYGAANAAAPCFWLLQSAAEKNVARAGTGLHVSFVAPTREAVERFHACALQAGGKDAGAPGERPEYTRPFYGAFVRDLDGFKIEAVCRAP
jgi:catechol 2,3-dioxygenase-like lactoylglutathione lyase family enzyme